MIILRLSVEPRSRMPDLKEQIFQTSLEYWKSCGHHGIHCVLTTEPCIEYENLIMVKLSVYKLQCQDSIYLKYCIAFMIQASSGQLRITKTVAKLQEWFYTSTYKEDVEGWNLWCVTCAATKGTQARLYGKLHKSKAGHSFERIAMNFAGPIPMSCKGNQHTLVEDDYFSKWSEAYPVPTIDVPEKVGLCGKLISQYGVPLELHADHAGNFKSNLFSEMCKQLKINSTLPWSNWMRNNSAKYSCNINLGCWASRGLEPLYSFTHVGISIFDS